MVTDGTGASQPICNGLQGPAGPAGAAVVAVSEDEAFGYASNIVVTIADFPAPFIPLGISRVGVDIDALAATTGADWEYSVYRPDVPKYPDVTLIVPPAGIDAATSWFTDAANGEPAHRNMTVQVVDPGNGSAAIEASLFDCFPRMFDQRTGLLTVGVERLEVSGTGSSKSGSAIDNPAPIAHGYSVNSAVSEATAVRGGALLLQLADTTTGSDPFQSTSPGHKEVSPLFARLDWPAAAVYEWINETLLPENETWKRTVEILTTDAAGLTSVIRYVDAFPIRFNVVNPLLILPGDLMPATVDLTVKPNRVQTQ